MGFSPQEIADALREGQFTLLDARPQERYRKEHIAGSVSAPFARSGWGTAVARWLEVHGQGKPLGIVAENAQVAQSVTRVLEDVGLRPAVVWERGLNDWTAAGLPLASVTNITADELRNAQERWTIIDVREPYEWRSGVIPGALTIPLQELSTRVQDLDAGKAYAIVCASGNRSQTAAAYLADQGLKVANVYGGMAMWLAGRYPVEVR